MVLPPTVPRHLYGTKKTAKNTAILSTMNVQILHYRGTINGKCVKQTTKKH